MTHSTENYQIIDNELHIKIEGKNGELIIKKDSKGLVNAIWHGRRRPFKKTENVLKVYLPTLTVRIQELDSENEFIIEYYR